MIRKLSGRIRPWLRLAAFFVFPAIVLFFCNLFLGNINKGVFYSFYDLSRQDDVEMVLIGSSVTETNFNPNIITEETGLKTYSAGIGHMSMPGALATTRFVFESNRPEYVCLIVEPDNFNVTTESIYTQMQLTPHIFNPLTAIKYYLDLCTQDGQFFERLFLFRSYMPDTVAEIKDTFDMLTDPVGYYQESEFGKSGYYRGNGYNRSEQIGNGEAALRFMSMRPVKDYDYNADLTGFSKRKILEFKALCEKYGAQPVVILSPNMVAHALAKDGFAENYVSVETFCRQNQIPCLNFYFAREEYVPRLDHYYYDVLHMDNQGADMFSRYFSEVFNQYVAGQPIDHIFYQTAEEYLESIHCIANTWVEKTTDGITNTYTADCLRGASVVPEYSFHILHPDGTTTMLQPYSADHVFRCPVGSYADQKLRVYVRDQNDDAESIIFYDFSS